MRVIGAYLPSSIAAVEVRGIATSTSFANTEKQHHKTAPKTNGTRCCSARRSENSVIAATSTGNILMAAMCYQTY